MPAAIGIRGFISVQWGDPGGSLGKLPLQTFGAPRWMAPISYKCTLFGANRSGNRD